MGSWKLGTWGWGKVAQGAPGDRLQCGLGLIYQWLVPCFVARPHGREWGGRDQGMDLQGRPTVSDG